MINLIFDKNTQNSNHISLCPFEPKAKLPQIESFWLIFALGKETLRNGKNVCGQLRPICGRSIIKWESFSSLSCNQSSLHHYLNHWLVDSQFPINNLRKKIKEKEKDLDLL